MYYAYASSNKSVNEPDFMAETPDEMRKKIKAEGKHGVEYQTLKVFETITIQETVQRKLSFSTAPMPKSTPIVHPDSEPDGGSE